MNTDGTPATNGHDPYAALRLGDFRLFVVGNVVSVLGMQMQAAVVAWEVWRRTQSELTLGLIGLVQFLPILGLSLIGGNLADRVNRRLILMGTLSLIALSSIGLAAVSQWDLPIELLFACLFTSGVARAFQQPAKASFLPLIVPREHFSNAVTWNTGVFHLASVFGPALGGLSVAVFDRGVVVYLFDAVAAGVFVVTLCLIRPQRLAVSPQGFSIAALFEAFRFLWRVPTMFAAITLDLFAVLLGGSTALLPVFAGEHYLNVGATGYGWLRSAQAIGAVAMALVLAHAPPMRRAGRSLLLAVAGFGIATIVFGFSHSFWLSFPILLAAGALDNISVVIRHTLMQMLPPDELRGRVSAVNGLFINASNELGSYESGLVAHLFRAYDGPTISVVSGGVGTMVVVTLVALLSPALRRYGALGSAAAVESEALPRESG